MKCPNCGRPSALTTETRASRGGRSVRRRRKCSACHFRWSTVENVIEGTIDSPRQITRTGQLERLLGEVLTDVQVKELRERYAAGETAKALADEHGIEPRQACLMIQGHKRKEAGGPIVAGSLRGRRTENLKSQQQGANPFFA